MSDSSRHIVAVVGGAVAGSVAARLLADHGVEVVVFEQNARPYGKIEDGLPRWHATQREQEYARIDERLDHPAIHFVPHTRLGEDLDFHELATEWGLSALVLANGAWRDRPLPVDGAAEAVGRGLEYQNPFIYWFNHQHEPGYAGPAIEVPDDVVVVGGGLASIDVVKACQLYRYGAALRRLGHEVSLHDLEAKGIPATCEHLGIDPEALGIPGALLVYRRTAEDMPLAQPPDGATAEQVEKTRGVRRKILDRAMAKYCFRFQDTTAPVALDRDASGRVRGLVATRTAVVDGRVRTAEGSEHTLPAGLVVSSIGSLPEPIPGVEMDGDTYAIADEVLGVYAPLPGVFAVGNVVTGQGNIRLSLQHATTVTEHLLDEVLCGVRAATGEAAGVAAAEAVRGHLDGRMPPPPATVAEILDRVRAHQARSGCTAGYAAWMHGVRV